MNGINTATSMQAKFEIYIRIFGRLKIFNKDPKFGLPKPVAEFISVQRVSNLPLNLTMKRAQSLTATAVNRLSLTIKAKTTLHPLALP
jgi:hypothetical protein